jgi:hypothetical protein
MAARDFLLAEAPVPYRADAERIVVGRCPALNEALHGAAALWQSGGREGGDPLHWLPLDGPVASGCRLTWVRRAVASGPPPAPTRSPGDCVAMPGGLRGLCAVAQHIPGFVSLERALAREVSTQIALANASPVAWYEARQKGETGSGGPIR